MTAGISAEQRTNTARRWLTANHTEAAVDFCALADLPEVDVICELANDDGTVLKGPQIDAFASEHGLSRISIADVIA